MSTAVVEVQERVAPEAESFKRIKPRHMMATTAYHSTFGDLSREKHQIAMIYGEEEGAWVGGWTHGLGIYDVLFPKASTRPLSWREIWCYMRQNIHISSQPALPFCLRHENPLIDMITRAIFRMRKSRI